MGCGVSVQAGTHGDLLAKLRDPSAEVRRKAVSKVAESGAAGVLYASNLIDLLGDPDLEVRRRTVKALGNLVRSARENAPAIATQLAAKLADVDPKTRLSAEEALKDMHTYASSALPILASYLSGESHICLAAIRVLSCMGQSAAPVCIEAAKAFASENADIRKEAEAFLARLGDGAAPALPELVKLLSQERDDVCLAALRVITSVGAQASIAAASITCLLSHTYGQVRLAAASALVALGEHAGPAAPEISAFLDTEHTDVNVAAARLLGGLGANSAPFAADLARMLPREDAECEAAAAALKRLGTHAATAVPVLTDQLVYSTKEADLCIALDVLQELGALAAPAAVTIPSLLASSSYDVRGRGIELFVSLGKAGLVGPAVPGVSALLSHELTAVRQSASDALKRLNAISGSGDSLGVAALAAVGALSSVDYGARSKAMETLVDMGDNVATAAPEIAKLLAHDNTDVRQSGLVVLRGMSNKHAAVAAPTLLGLLTNSRHHVRTIAEQMLQELGECAVEQIKTTLRDSEDWQRRRRVVEQLGKLGELAAPYIPAVVHMMEDERLELRIVVACFLRDLQKQNPGIIPSDVTAKVKEFADRTLLQHAPPTYWSNCGSEFDDMVYVSEQHHDRLSDLLRQTYLARVTQDRPCLKNLHKKIKGGCPCVQPMADPGLPVEYLVHRVLRVENSLMWLRYVLKRDAIRQRRAEELEPFRRFEPPILSAAFADGCPELLAPLDHGLNEAYLFHGTSARAALSIARTHFCIDLAGSNTGTMYGAGAYLGESITKADEYAKDEPGGHYDDVFAVLVCRAVMGKLYHTTKRDEEAGAQVASGACDSTCGDRSVVASTFRELVVYDNDQLYPEYIVFYRRVHARDRPGVVERLRLPFFTELPPYWANCFRAADGSPEFLERHRVGGTALATLQALARGSLHGTEAGRWAVREAWRVENSETWRRFADFRARLRRRRSLPCAPAPALELTTAACLKAEPGERSLAAACLEAAVNEQLLWHATSSEAAESIARMGFRPPSGDEAAAGLRFGAGTYFAEGLDKALAYAMAEGDGARCVLLCRVVCGEFHVTDSAGDQGAMEKAAALDRDSVLAIPGGSAPREVVARDVAQVYPEFILYLERREE